ncbi:unnamed protein product [Caenorhabditis bovis]|uniref:Uncharacterized protein n=1 Tax=Caenorhabditis bovis TaxID=2654633 RepID=A0A8S1ED77_9PELO|nr:unnamed protein product [Caenorhabditis bovis]
MQGLDLENIMIGAYHFSNQGPFSNIVDSEKTYRYCRLHIQTWVYVHCVVSMITSIIGIGIGIIFLTLSEWHEKLFIYRLTLAYMRRANPIRYWMVYRIFFIVWILFHLIHFATILLTIVAVQKNSIKLLKPQLVMLIFLAGSLIFGFFGLLIISVTGSKFAWITIGIILFHLFFVASNLILLSAYHKFLDEKISALNELLMQQAKTVHFKDTSSEDS